VGPSPDGSENNFPEPRDHTFNQSRAQVHKVSNDYRATENNALDVADAAVRQAMWMLRDAHNVRDNIIRHRIAFLQRREEARKDFDLLNTSVMELFANTPRQNRWSHAWEMEISKIPLPRHGFQGSQCLRRLVLVENGTYRRGFHDWRTARGSSSPFDCCQLSGNLGKGEIRTPGRQGTRTSPSKKTRPKHLAASPSNRNYNWLRRHTRTILLLRGPRTALQAYMRFPYSQHCFQPCEGLFFLTL
jgi:hypothetical protein